MMDSVQENTANETVLDEDITFEPETSPAAEPQSQPASAPQFTYEQVENLLRLATQNANRPQEPQVDPLEVKEKEKTELYVRLQQGDADALVKYMSVLEEVAALKAQRAAVQAARQQTAGQTALMNVRQVLDEFRTREASSAVNFKAYENQWYNLMVQQAQNDPSLFTDLGRAREAGELLLGRMVLNQVRQRKAPAVNPQRDPAGKFAAADKPPQPEAKLLPPEAAQAGFTSVEEWEKYSGSGWVPLD